VHVIHLWYHHGFGSSINSMWNLLTQIQSLSLAAAAAQQQVA
jgi:hypothetical protein